VVLLAAPDPSPSARGGTCFTLRQRAEGSEHLLQRRQAGRRQLEDGGRGSPMRQGQAPLRRHGGHQWPARETRRGRATRRLRQGQGQCHHIIHEVRYAGRPVWQGAAGECPCRGRGRASPGPRLGGLVVPVSAPPAVYAPNSRVQTNKALSTSLCISDD
jgi:hypothetical protein